MTAPSGSKSQASPSKKARSFNVARGQIRDFILTKLSDKLPSRLKDSFDSPLTSRSGMWWLKPFAYLGFAILTTFSLSQFKFDYLEAVFYDARLRTRPAPQPSGHIELIYVDSETISALGKVPTARDHLDLLIKLQAAGARHIVQLISPTEFVGSLEELTEYAKVAEATRGFVVARNDVALRGEENGLRLDPPFEKLNVGSASVPRDSNIFARDDVSRRLLIAYQGQPTLWPTLAADFNADLKAALNLSSPPLAAAEDAGEVEVRAGFAQAVRGSLYVLQSDQIYVNFAPSGTYPSQSFARVLRGESAEGRFKDKVVIIGRDIQTTSKDYVRTPYSREIVAMTAVEYHANALDTLIRNDAPVRAAAWVDHVFTALISLLTVIVVLKLKPTLGLMVLLATVASFTLIAWLMFALGGVWLSMAQPYLAVFIGYYFFIPYRLIIENRRSWEYYQKNKLLTQVEELKTNFMSMMSHDLKTPIARIEGMVEIVENERDRLSSRQVEALATLRNSSHELLEFVSSILNLGRIESKAIQLHLHSKDVNSLIKEVVQKLEYQAKSKNIQIRTELEPLFSIKMDVDLMRQVLQNLIENAIKYSPPGTSVLVSTEEGEGWISVQVADQGPGIPEDELPHIFMKFYRSRNAKASTIKGSGLGLYLARYFVELHKGRITVDSSPGAGSTFTVELPSN